jgi:NADH/F420H2 dehydrogenase subunit C
MKANKNISCFKLMNYILSLFPYYLNETVIVKYDEDSLVFVVKKENLILLLNFLKNHYWLKFKTLISITAIDFPERYERFELNYFLLSHKLNKRIVIRVSTDDIRPIPSITSIYKSANWYEREVWDLFGVFFSRHPDLRRILTDYGFEGFPFRKDFPQTGYVEVRYDDQKKYVLYEPIEFTQEFRYYDFMTPWTNIK